MVLSLVVDFRSGGRRVVGRDATWIIGRVSGMPSALTTVRAPLRVRGSIWACYCHSPGIFAVFPGNCNVTPRQMMMERPYRCHFQRLDEKGFNRHLIQKVLQSGFLGQQCYPRTKKGGLTKERLQRRQGMIAVSEGKYRVNKHRCDVYIVFDK